MKQSRNRLAEQEVLAELGLLALKGTDIPTLLQEVASRLRQVFSVEYCEILELMPERNKFLLRSSAGWRNGYVGQAVTEINLDSQAGYTLIEGGPVRVEDVSQETRFSNTSLLEEHGVRSSITTIYRQGHIYGVLGAHTVQSRTFSDDEASLLSSIAELLGAALERSLSEENVRIEMMKRTEQAEVAERRFKFLADASAVLSMSSDYAGALSCTARLAGPPLADWCFVDVLRVKGGAETYIHRLVVHADATEATEGLAKELQYYYPLDPTAPHSTPRVLRSGQPELIVEVTDEVLEDIA